MKTKILNDISCYLEQLREKTKLKGSSIEDKVNFAKSRWEKCALDCKDSLDTSLYRSQFGQVHESIFESLNFWVKEQYDLISILNMLSSIKSSYMGSINVLSLDFEKNRGAIDAMCILIVEIECILAL